MSRHESDIDSSTANVEMHVNSEHRDLDDSQLVGDIREWGRYVIITWSHGSATILAIVTTVSNRQI